MTRNNCRPNNGTSINIAFNALLQQSNEQKHAIGAISLASPIGEGKGTAAP